MVAKILRYGTRRLGGWQAAGCDQSLVTPTLTPSMKSPLCGVKWRAASAARLDDPTTLRRKRHRMPEVEKCGVGRRCEGRMNSPSAFRAGIVDVVAASNRRGLLRLLCGGRRTAQRKLLLSGAPAQRRKMCEATKCASGFSRDSGFHPMGRSGTRRARSLRRGDLGRSRPVGHPCHPCETIPVWKSR